jgi:hypothetical protein
MALAMPIHACEHSTFAIGLACPEGDFGVGVEVSAPPESRLQAWAW